MSVTDAIKRKVTAVTETSKIADLQRNIVDQTGAGLILTTDHGVKVADHDNWYVARRLGVGILLTVSTG